MTQYVALVPIMAGDALAYAAGDPVPEANVERLGYVVGEQVADAATDQAQVALQGLGIVPGGEDQPTGDGEVGEVVNVTDGAYDPADHTVEEVNDWLSKNPNYADRVLKAETRGKHRAGIVHGPHGTPPDVAEG